MTIPDKAEIIQIRDELKVVLKIIRAPLAKFKLQANINKLNQLLNK